MSRKYGRYQSKHYFSSKSIDFNSEYVDYNQFLLQEFFSADSETLKRISIYYIEVYGNLSYGYLKRKYAEWAYGNYHITSVMKERILDLMPRFLSEEAKEKIGKQEFVACIKYALRTFHSNQKEKYRRTINIQTPEELITVFQKELKNIESHKVRYFHFNVLSNNEKLEALEICKYILETKLQILFDKIEKDLNTFLPYMSIFLHGIFSGHYSINHFNLKIDLTNLTREEIQIPQFKIKEILINTQFKEFADKYLAYEILNIKQEAKKTMYQSFLNRTDLELFYTHYNELWKGGSEVNLNSMFQGEGGTLVLRAHMKPIKLIKQSIIASASKLAIYLSVLAILIFIIIKTKFYVIFLLGGVYVIAYGFMKINEEIKLLTSLIKGLKKKT